MGWAPLIRAVLDVPMIAPGLVEYIFSIERGQAVPRFAKISTGPDMSSPGSLQRRTLIGSSTVACRRTNIAGLASKK